MKEPVKPARDISDSVFIKYDELKQIFGARKSIPPAYAKQLIYALSYFPELANARIKLKVNNSPRGIISTNPTFGSIFRRSSKRTYMIKIFEPSAESGIPLFMNAGVNGQVGIFGHELCHLVYFNQKTGLGLLGLGIAHISTGYMDRFERNTDSMTIVRGLGYQLLAWKSYLDEGFRAMRGEGIPDDEKLPGSKRYMSVEAIEELISRTPVYLD